MLKLVGRHGINCALIGLDCSEPGIRAAFAAEGFVAVGEDARFLLLNRTP